MKGRAHPSPFPALSFPNSKKVLIYCWVDRESFPVVAWRSPVSNSRFTATFCTITEPLQPGLEKLTNLNRSVSSVNDRLFPVELTEIADWKSMSEYMLHSKFGKAFSGVIGGNFGAYTFILPLSCLLNICLSFWMFYLRKIYLNKIKNLRNFRE